MIHRIAIRAVGTPEYCCRRYGVRGLCLLSLLLSGHALGEVDPTAQITASGIEHSVGRLWVPAIRYAGGYARHYDEQCSGTLVSNRAGDTRSRLVISAWHCLEDYRDLSRPLIFENAGGLRREARILASGGSMDSDWALLQLSTALPRPSFLAAAGPQAMTGSQVIIMAGYPQTENPGGPKQQVQRQCAVTGFAGRDRESSCVLRVGASGGGVFSTGGDPSYLGVISRGDGQSRSIYVPLARFERRLRPHL